MAALVRLLLLLVLAPAALLLAGPAMLPAAAGRPGPKLLVEVAVGAGDVPVVVGERNPVPVKQTGEYTLSRAPRKPPSGPSPIHNDVGPAGFVVRRITAESSAGGSALEDRVEGKAAAAAADHKDRGLPSSESQILGTQDRQLPASASSQ